MQQGQDRKISSRMSYYTNKRGSNEGEGTANSSQTNVKIEKTSMHHSSYECHETNAA